MIGTGDLNGFRLDGGGQSVVFLVDERGAPRLGYWGPSLGPADPMAALAGLADRAVAPGMLDRGEALSWLPEAGQGFTGHPAVIAHREGRELITQLRIADLAATAGAARVRLADQTAQVEVEIDLALDADTGVLSSRAKIRNLAGSPLSVEWLAAGTLASPHAEIMTFDGRWAREFMPVRRVLTDGLIVKENRTGRTSHHAPPFLIAGEVGFGEHRGEVFAAHLAWSGDHRLLAERLRDGRIQIQAGELLHSGEITLAQAEAYETPILYLVRSAEGLTGVSDRLHPFVRSTILGGRLRARPRPVGYNTWEAVYFDHEVETLKTLADLAAQVGAERFVLDDGWFKGRSGDSAGLGDWVADPVKYPAGLAPLIDHVRGLGMEFGLWVEPEMANANSDLIRAHPDWVLGVPGREQPLGRRQYVLDLTRAEVAEAIFTQLDALLAEHPIAYLKWDMNRDLTHAVSDGRAATHAQTLALYALIDRLRASHPGVEIESCASGGGRADYGILCRTERIWPSDCIDPIERQAIQRAFSIFFPPELMGAHVGARASHTTARSSSLTLRALTAITGHMGVEADLRAFTPAERERLAAAIALHKEIRGWLHEARTVRLDHPDPGCVALAMVGEGEALVLAAQVGTPAGAALAPLRVEGLDETASYQVRPLIAPKAPRRTMGGTPFLALGEPLTAAGALLAHTGLPLPILRAGQIAAWRLTRVSASGRRPPARRRR